MAGRNRTTRIVCDWCRKWTCNDCGRDVRHQIYARFTVQEIVEGNAKCTACDSSNIELYLVKHTVPAATRDHQYELEDYMKGRELHHDTESNTTQGS